MATQGDIPEENIDVFVGYDSNIRTYVAQDRNGAPSNTVTRIGGTRGSPKFPTAISWTIWNRTDHAVDVLFRDIQRDAEGRCPVEGGDFSGCEAERRKLQPGDSARVATAINPNAEIRRYGYEIHISRSETQEGNRIDPELQIDT